MSVCVGTLSSEAPRCCTQSLPNEGEVMLIEGPHTPDDRLFILEWAAFHEDARAVTFADGLVKVQLRNTRVGSSPRSHDLVADLDRAVGRARGAQNL